VLYGTKNPQYGIKLKVAYTKLWPKSPSDEVNEWGAPNHNNKLQITNLCVEL
jgi:hypothetical protein